MIHSLSLNQRLIDAGFGSGTIGIHKREVADLITDRVSGLLADYRSFLYVRATNKHKHYGLGGGNVTLALSAFSIINLLSKTCYFIDKPQKFTPHPIEYFKVNETNAFCHFIKLLVDNHIHLGIEREDSDGQNLIWKGFRDHLAHLGTVEHGKQVVSFEFEEKTPASSPINLDEIIEGMVSETPFHHDGTGRNWRVFIDILFTRIEKEILPFVIEKIIAYKTDDQSARNLYKLVAGRRDLA